MNIRVGARRAVAGLISGYLGGVAMDAATSKLLELEPEQDRKREEAVSPGPSYTVAAKDLAGRAGVELSDRKAESIGSAFHTGLALVAGEMYVSLRRVAGLGPAASGLLVSALLFAGVDEGLTPLMGWSASPAAYPLKTHLRGAVGHVVLGAVVATTAEVLLWMLE